MSLLLLRPPPQARLFPYTTLFRSFRLRNGNKALVATVGGRRALWLPTQLGYDLLLEPVRPQALLDRLRELAAPKPDRKSTRLNSSHVKISYAVFCLKKKKNR